ncbi:hypothetical protein CKO18_13395 [Rhodoferax fermentans]|uniref:Uncharacterized protein n=1 Tax=Rhodoferax fermentans TaxID=28066 RepID=A0A1T1AN66_RHOFE|nr:hypothetical protein [Rhodoferax fermentans]OOV05572.1 hypothetical protein RF819_01590 [Rhodoferax fermentans]
MPYNFQANDGVSGIPAFTPPVPAKWGHWAADDFWYSSMRKSPNASATRIQDTNVEDQQPLLKISSQSYESAK